MKKSMQKPKRIVTGICSQKIAGKSRRSIKSSKTTKTMLTANVVWPKVNGEIRLRTYGRLEIGDVPKRLLTTRAMPADWIMTARISSR